jgi:hypothetical protein
MRTPLAPALLVLLLLDSTLLADEPEPISPQQPTPLFDGRTLDGWYAFQKQTGRKDPTGVYTVEDGAIRVSGEGAGYLATERAYRDYHLSLEYRWGERTDGTGIVRNSGLLLHGVGPDGAANGVWMTSLEVQLAQGCEGDFIVIRGKRTDGTPYPSALTSNVRIAADKKTRWDPDGEPTKWTGRQFWWKDHEPFFKETLDNRGKDDAASPVGEWTRVEAICAGDRVTVKINGETVNEAYDLRPAAGRILLQNEGSEVWFRKVVLRPLAKE